MPNRMYERMMYDRAMRARNYRDGRNPYGSAGGYVVSKRNYDREDERRYDRDDERNYDRDYNYDRDECYDRDYAVRDGIRQYYNSDYDYDYNYDYDGHHLPYMSGMYGYYGAKPFEVNTRYSPEMFEDHRRYRTRDYGEKSEYLTKDEIAKWTKKLLEKVDDKELFSKDKILKKTEETGIKFEKITPDEFYLTVLMVYTDYCRTFGNAVDTYIRLAKDWLMDDDVEKKFGKKLAAYYHNVVKDED